MYNRHPHYCTQSDFGATRYNDSKPKHTTQQRDCELIRLERLEVSTPSPSGILTHASCYVERRATIAQWLVDGVSKTANALAWPCWLYLPGESMPFDSKKHPKDALEHIRNGGSECMSDHECRPGRHVLSEETHQAIKCEQDERYLGHPNCKGIPAPLQALPYPPDDDRHDEPSSRKKRKDHQKDKHRERCGKVEHLLPAIWVPDAKAESCMRCGGYSGGGDDGTIVD